MSSFFEWEKRFLHYQCIDGDTDRPCLVFLHEGLGSVATWKDFPEQLCARTGCPGLLFDRIGHGRSDPMATPRGIDYLHWHAREELPAVIEGLIPGQPHILVGHSDGGSIALIYAAMGPALLRGSITEAAHVMVEPETLVGIEKAVEAFQTGALAGLEKYHAEKTLSLLHAWADTWRSPWFRTWNLIDLLSDIESPLLVIQGREDAYATDAQVDAIVSKVSGPVTPMLIDDCGHTPHREKPAAVQDAMAAFIEALP